MPSSPSWLCPAPADRDRVLDMQRRPPSLRRLCSGAVGLALVAVAALLAITLGVPALVIATAGSVVAVTGASIALMRAQPDHRSEVVIDPLTGMLNRHALATRLSELAQLSEINRQPVALVIGDLDRFRSINDGHGRPVGDAVLEEVAYRIRGELRAYDLAYRLGGEEFLILLPGATAEDAMDIAETLRATVEGAPVAGLMITMSFGVSASVAGPFDYREVFSAADQALYAAKHAGRNCVHANPPLAHAVPPVRRLYAVQ